MQAVVVKAAFRLKTVERCAGRKRRQHPTPFMRCGFADSIGAGICNACRRGHQPGGIFFDYLEGEFDKVFAFVRDAGDAFISAWAPIVEKRKGLPYSDRQRAFQEYRRGRYVEFNLLYDRGTLFGLKTGGRIESILMSLPPVVRYVYDWHPEPGSPEAELYDYYLKPRDWVEEN